MSRNPSPVEIALDDFVQTVRTAARDFEVEFHADKGAAFIETLNGKLAAIRSAAPPPPTPQLAAVVPLPDPAPEPSVAPPT